MAAYAPIVFVVGLDGARSVPCQCARVDSLLCSLILMAGVKPGSYLMPFPTDLDIRDILFHVPWTIVDSWDPVAKIT
jgi:hypothetical protein